MFLFSKSLHQNKYQVQLHDFEENVNPEVGYEVIEALGDEIIPLLELPMDNQKIVVFNDLVYEKTQNDIINYFINSRHRNGAFHSLLDHTRDRNFSFFYYDKAIFFLQYFLKTRVVLFHKNIASLFLSFHPDLVFEILPIFQN